MNLSNRSNQLSDNSVLIIESVGKNLEVKQSGSKGIVLEGVCAVFGKMNNNRRVYEKDEYLPHLTYLNESIKKQKLVGSLDHPPTFEVSLKDASHIITGLSYDGQDKVNIRLQILENTPNGRIAKALLDGGVNLSISSRAAGQVNANGLVKLDRIFTYDLVGEPGFTEAVLKRTLSENLKNNFQMITESYQNMKEHSIVQTNKLQDISESLGFSDNFKIYKINKKNGSGELFNESIRSNQKNNIGAMTDFVTKQEMNQYSKVLKEQFQKVKRDIATQTSILESSKNQDPSSNLKLVGFINYLAEQLEGVVNYTDYISQKLNESIKYTEHVAETTNQGIQYSNYIGEKLNQSVQHQDYLAEKMNQSINYQEYIAERLNQSINYSEYIKENVEKSVRYQNYLAEELDKSLQYTEYVAEGANKGLEYSEYLAESITRTRGYAEYLSEKIGQNIDYTEYVAESMNGGAVGSRNVLGTIGNLSESSVDALVAKVDRVINEVHDTSANAVLENRYPFLKVLSKPKQKAFFNLDSQVKKAVVETLNSAVWFNEADVTSIIESVINHKSKDVPTHVKFIPNEYKPTWNVMNENEKNRIHAKAQLYDLRTPYQVKSFWDEQDLRGINERVETQKQNLNKMQRLNESQSTEGLLPVEQVVEMQRGYSQTYLETLKRQADYRNR
jgi:hypothetical protein